MSNDYVQFLHSSYSLEIVACIGNFDINNLNQTTYSYDPFDTFDAGSSTPRRGGVYADYANGIGALSSGFRSSTTSSGLASSNGSDSNGSSKPIPLQPAIWACSHVISTYVIADVLHFAAFCIGLYAERVLRSEHLYALMEKV